MDGGFGNPQRGECDLVMKGGITSGVVYPQAILKLAEEYRFRSLGGGSVGAIAAALTAAAEVGRQSRGFDRLQEEQAKLERDPRFLLELFRPTESTRPLMNTLLSLTEVNKRKGWVHCILSAIPVLVRNNPAPFLKGALVGVVLGAVFVLAMFLLGPIVSMSALALLLGFAGGLIWVFVVLLRILLKRVPSENFYGLCTGHEDDDTGRQKVLTDWLSELLDDIGEKEENRPLTFADLKGDSSPNGEASGIDLRVLATNLNHTEPYVFPRKFNTFIFKTGEMRELLPGYVVDYMEENAANQEDVKLPPGCHFLPQGDALPVIVPVRMAVSFPLLLSAVPLYTIRSVSGNEQQPRALQVAREVPETELQRNWFSDGGICSNFPIHFFDAWLPKRPTFGINLTSLLEETNTVEFSVSKVGEGAIEEDANSQPNQDDDRYVWLPAPEAPDNPEWTDFKGLIGFGRAVFRSAQNYRDNMQSRLPSYQERIVQVRLREGEGGLNLAMEPRVIDDLVNRGKKAGTKLLSEFDFEHHKWVRLRVLLNQLESNLKEVGADRLDPQVIKDLLRDQSEEDFPFNDDTSEPGWIVEAQERIEQLSTLIKKWSTAGSSAGGVDNSDRQGFFEPVTDAEPQPELRVTPDV